MEEGSSILKLTFLLVLAVASSSLISPFMTEARQKIVHHNNGHHHVKPFPLPPTQPPSTETPPIETPPTDTPPIETSPTTETPPTETPPTETPPIETPPTETPPNETPPSQTPPSETPPWETPPIKDSFAPSPSPYGFPPGYVAPPYQPHGCHYPCIDSNDCDGPCTVCCWNNTCCYDWPEDPPMFR